MLPLHFGILAEAINTMHLISIEQENGEGNALRTICLITKVISTGNLKTVLFLLP